MVTTAVEAARQFRHSLNDLDTKTHNYEHQIIHLTLLAKQFSSHQQHIVRVIKEQIYIVPQERKLLIFFVIDSILENVTSGHYAALFEKILAKVCVHIVTTGDKQVREALLGLRKKWMRWFSESVLWEVDTKIHELDATWPKNNPFPNYKIPGIAVYSVMPGCTVSSCACSTADSLIRLLRNYRTGCYLHKFVDRNGEDVQ